MPPVLHLPSRSLSALALAAAALGAAVSPVRAAMLTNPPILMTPQGIEYMCGGRNRDEVAFMERVAPRWAATFEFAMARSPRGPMAEPVQVKVFNKYTGDEVMHAASDEPFMLARLQEGMYDVQATLGPVTLTRTVTVALGAPGRALFVWPSNVDLAAAHAPAQAQTRDAPTAHTAQPERTAQTAHLSDR